MAFVGEYSAKLDDKGRLIFPVAFRTTANAEPSQNRFVVKRDIFEQCLVIYPIVEWDQQTEKVLSKLNLYKPEHNAFWKEYNRDTAEIIPDEKTGRITVPKKLMEMAGIDKEAVFIGVGNVINLWNKILYESSAMPKDQFASMAESLLGD